MESLTAIIPIGFTNGNLFHLKETINKCYERQVEVVLVHDDHNDGTRELLENLKLENPWIYIERGIFRAPGKARNAGLKYVETEWFCFWDVDDIPNVENISEALSNSISIEVEVLVGFFTIKDAMTEQHETWSLPNIQKRAAIEIAVNPGLWRFVFRSKQYRDCVFEDSSMGEDQLYLAQANINFNKMELVRKEFYVYITNQVAQLTSDVPRVVQLHSIIRAEARLQQSKNAMNFRDMLIVKQSLTLMKKGYFNKIQTLWILIHSVIRLKFNSIFLVITILNENRKHKR